MPSDAAVAAGQQQERAREMKRFMKDADPYNFNGQSVICFVGQGEDILRLMEKYPQKQFVGTGNIGYTIQKIDASLFEALKQGTAGTVLLTGASVAAGFREHREGASGRSVGFSLKNGLSAAADRVKHALCNYLIVQFFDKAVHAIGHDSNIASPARAGQLVGVIARYV
jgi:hypothetical protein